jgi:hypothetical protein
MQIRDVYSGSRIRIFSIPDLFLNSRKYYPGCIHPGSGSGYFTHPGSRDPGVQKKGTGSQIRNTGDINSYVMNVWHFQHLSFCYS